MEGLGLFELFKEVLEFLVGLLALLLAVFQALDLFADLLPVLLSLFIL